MSIALENLDYAAIKRAKLFSTEKVLNIREQLNGLLKDRDSSKKFSIITTGSYARQEASIESDIDLFLIADDVCDLGKETRIIQDIIDKEVIKPPGNTNTFGAEIVEPIQVLLHNLGGDSDDNKKLTRRMLLLLEGTWLYNEEKFETYRKRLIEIYIKEGISNEKIAKFLLNDIIRYYRTITTDFEYKVSEAKKSWGLRNLKLLFSRKLLYFSGILVVAETYNLPREEKIGKVLELINLTPLERIAHLKESTPTEILRIYEEFLSTISNPSVRESLDSVERDNQSSNQEFINLKELGKVFSQELSKWLKEKYPDNHPIHHSLLF